MDGQQALEAAREAWIADDWVRTLVPEERLLGILALDSAVAAALARFRELAWQEGFDAAYDMARCWGHVDYWAYGDYPTNPYLAAVGVPADQERNEQ